MNWNVSELLHNNFWLCMFPLSIVVHVYEQCTVLEKGIHIFHDKKWPNRLDTCSIHVKSNEIICPFSPQSQIQAQHEAVSFFSTIMYCACTDFITAYDNPAVKSIVIHTIPKYNLLTYKIHSNQYNKAISWDIFLNWKTLKSAH